MAATTSFQDIDHDSNHIAQEIRDVSLAAWNKNQNVYTAGLIPSKGHSKSTGTYYEYNRKYFMSTQVAVRLPGTVPPVATYQARVDSFLIPSNHLSVAVTNDEIVEASDTLDPIRDASAFLGSNFLYDYEKNFTDTFVVDNVWTWQAKGQTGTTTLPIDGTLNHADVQNASAGRFQQFDQAASDPIEIFITCIRTVQLLTGLRPNKLLIPRLVLDVLRNNAQVLQWIGGGTSGTTGGDEMVKNIISVQLGMPMSDITIVDFVSTGVAAIALADRAVQDHNFGQTSTPTFDSVNTRSMAKDCLFMYSEAELTKYTATGGCVLRNDGLISSLSGSDPALSSGQGADQQNLLIRSRYDKINFTTFVDGYFAYLNKIITPDLGFYLTDCIA